MPYRLALALLALAPAARAQFDAAAAESALKAAAAAVAPSVVRIETAGGREAKGADGVRKGLGPTTGVVVGAGGYVLTSTFNFADKPASVFVTVPGQPRRVAKQLATDKTRMLTLLKIEATGLSVPEAYPKAELRVGQWALALGRALGGDAAGPPSQSVGVVSALGRIYGKLVQCDAKVSPVNYGGPLVAIDGRVMGLLVPASPRGETEAAGVEWYDSGIGFAVPFADCLAAAEKLKAGDDLERGTLGILMKDAKELYNVPVAVGTVVPEGAAGQAGVKVGDIITKLDGQAVPNASALQHLLGPKYAGDAVGLVVTRGGKAVDLGAVTLAAPEAVAASADLGIAPLRDDPKPGVGVRGVFADSAAAKAGLKPGDRVTKVAPEDAAEAPRGLPPLKDRAALAAQLARLRPGTKVKLDVARAGGKAETLTVTLGGRAAGVPAEMPLPASAGGMKKLAGANPEKGLVRKSNPTLGRELWLYVPESYKPEVSHGVVVWLHRAGGGGKDADELVKVFKDFCAARNVILVAPQAKGKAGWVASEVEEVLQEVRGVLADYTIDKTRVVAHGMGNGGQMAFVLGFAARDFFTGVAAVGAGYGGTVKEPDPAGALAFFVAGGERDPVFADIEATAERLSEAGYPVLFRPIADFGRDYLPAGALKELTAWFDALDRV